MRVRALSGRTQVGPPRAQALCSQRTKNQSQTGIKHPWLEERAGEHAEELAGEQDEEGNQPGRVAEQLAEAVAEQVVEQTAELAGQVVEAGELPRLRLSSSRGAAMSAENKVICAETAPI